MPSNSPARRPANSRGMLCARVARLGIVALLFLMLPAAAGAYTLVLRSGRHVTVPDDFKVTPAAVIYEASPGFSVTVWLSNVDFATTERANGEPAGSFAKRIKPESGEGDAAARTPKAVKTERGTVRRVVTNKDLEPSRLRREEQEEEYERTRRQRGMPSKQEVQRRVEEEDRRLREWARQMREEMREAELESLRHELMNVRGDLNHLSLHLSRQAAGHAPAYAPPDYYPHFYQPPVQVITVFPFGHQGNFGRGRFRSYPQVRRWPHHAQPSHNFPPVFGPFRNGGFLRRVPPPATPGRR